MAVRRLILIVAASALGALSAYSPAQAAADESKVLQGKWRVVSAKQNGANFPKDRIEKMFIVVEKDEVRVFIEGTKSEQGATFAIDPKQNPKHIDFTKETRDSEWTDGISYKLFQSWKVEDRKIVPADNKIEGIYKLDGSSLTLCWRTTNAIDKPGAKDRKVRPSEFQSVLYYHQFLFVLERVT